MDRIRHVLHWLRGRLWIIPAVMSALALALAYLLLFSGIVPTGQDGAQFWWLFSGDPGTARDLLSTLLAGMITMTSLVVSITIVVLSLAAAQLGPRLIWNFVRDRQIQCVIGLFIATILYILVVLRSITGDLGTPHVAITVASALAIGCLFALLFHVNKLARSIISDTMVNDVAESLDQAITRLPMESNSQERERLPRPDHRLRRALELTRSGYVQLVDYSSLCALASRHDLLITLNIRPGQFALRGSEYGALHASAPVEDDVIYRAGQAIVLGLERTPTQDIEYSIRQLVEVGVRALSPGINDPFTAVAVINRLAAALASLANRCVRETHLRDNAGVVRVVAPAVDYSGLVDAAFHQIRQSAHSQVRVLIELARRLTELSFLVNTDRAAPIFRHLQILFRVTSTLPEVEDRRALERIIVPTLARASGGEIRADSPILAHFRGD